MWLDIIYFYFLPLHKDNLALEPFYFVQPLYVYNFTVII